MKKNALLERQLSNEEWETLHQAIMIKGREVMDMPLENFLERIREATQIGPLRDPFIYKDGEEYLFLMTAVVRDLFRFQSSCGRLLEHLLDERAIDAKKVKKANPPPGAERFSVADDLVQGNYDDNDDVLPEY